MIKKRLVQHTAWIRAGDQVRRQRRERARKMIAKTNEIEFSDFVPCNTRTGLNRRMGTSQMCSTSGEINVEGHYVSIELS